MFSRLICSLVLIKLGFVSLSSSANVVEDIVGDAVNVQGDLVYSTDIQLPSSIHSIRPDAELRYAKSHGRSNAGVGFTLSLTKQITRCSETKLSHGRMGGIEVNGASVYCLEGSVLIKQADGSYRKYIDDNTRVVISRGTHDKPLEWKATDVDGYRYTYGYNAGYSDISSQWFLTNKKDVFGNEISYSYGEKQQLKEIRYPGYLISLSYLEPLNAIAVYGGGSEIEQVGPIKRLKVERDDTQFLYEYVFGYEDTNGYQSVVDRRLASLKRCYGENTTECTNDKVFRYKDYPEPSGGYVHPGDKTLVITNEELEAHKFSGNDGLFFGVTPVDLNNDGVDEFCFYSKNDQLLCRNGAVSDNSLKVYASGFGYSENESNRFLNVFKGYDAEYFKRLNFIDLNNDNNQDLCLVVKKEVRCALYNLNTGRFGPVSIWNRNISGDKYYQFVDVTRDGAVDLCGAVSDNQTLSCYQNNGSGFERQVVVFNKKLSDKREYQYQDGTRYNGRRQVPNIKTSEYRVFSPLIIDITSDGILDLCLESEQSIRCYIGEYKNGVNVFSENIFQSVSSIYSEITISDNKQSANIKKDENNDITLSFRFIDVNGDALIDYCFYREEKYLCAINNENGFSDVSALLDINEEDAGDDVGSLLSGIHIVDINGDGYQDICTQYNSGQYCAYNRGGRFDSFENRIAFVVDKDIHLTKIKVFDNWIRARINEPTRHYFFNAVSVYSAPLFSSDLNADEQGEFCTRTVNGIECHSNHHAQPGALLSEVVTPLGAVTRFTYATSASKSIYSRKNQDSIEPTSLLLEKISVDSGVNDISGQPIFNDLEFNYYDFKFDKNTGKSLFGAIDRIDVSANRKMRSEFYTEGELAGQERKISDYNNGSLVSERINAMRVSRVSGQTQKRADTYAKTSKEFDPASGALLKSVETEFNNIDSLGYPGETLVTTNQEGVINVVASKTVFQHDQNNWLIGKPLKTVVTHRLSNQEAVEKTVEFTYYDNGSLKSEIIEPDSKMRLKTEYQYFDNGTLNSASVVGLVNGVDNQVRSTSYKYDQIGRLLSQTDAHGNTTRKTYHARCGGVENQYDIADRLVASNRYDSRCRIERTQANDGNWKETTIQWVDSEGENRYPLSSVSRSLARYSVTTTNANGSQSVTYFDRTGREIRTKNVVSKSGAGVTSAVVYKSYNRHGQIKAVSRPVRIENDSERLPEWSVYEYDNFGRVKNVTDIALDKSIRVTTSSYSGFSITTSFNDFEKTETSNIFGKNQSITEDGQTITHQYYSDGSLSQTDHSGQITTITYDDRGFKSSMNDSASGLWLYKYNAFGELYWQQDAEGNVMTIGYDSLGRKITEHRPEGQVSWVYYDTGNGVGQVSKELAVDNHRSFSYDNLGRVDTVTLSIDGKEIVTKHHYDAIGRSSQVVLNSSGNMPTPVYTGYNDGGAIQSFSVPASALKSFQFSKMDDDLTATLDRIKQLDQLINSAMKRVVEHEARAQEFYAKADIYERSLGVAHQLVKNLRQRAKVHAAEAEINNQLSQEYLKVSKKFTGDVAVRRHIYKGSNGKVHNFGYKGGCAEKKYKWGIFKRCVRYHYYAFEMSSADFGQLSALTRNTKECRENWSDLRIRSGKTGTRLNPKYSQGKHLRTDSKKVRSGSAKSGYSYKTVQTKVYEWCKAKEYSPVDLYRELAQKYKNLYEQKKKYISYAKKSEGDFSKDITQRSDGRWQVSGLNLVGGSISNPGDDYKASSLNALMNHYQARIQYYNGLADVADKASDAASDEVTQSRTDRVTALEAKQKLLEKINALASVEQLKALAQNQSELIAADARLTVWSALNWHTDGRLKDEVYGNGLYTYRTFDDSTGGLDSIVTKNARGHTLSDVHYQFNARGYVTAIEDRISGYTDSYQYDADKLDYWSRSGHGKTYSYDYQYDDLGNLTHKQSDRQLNVYGDKDRPYQLTQHNGLTVSYDKKGFITRSGDASYTWNSFGKAERIEKLGRVTRFNYDAGGNRVKRIDSQGTTYYVAPGYEQLVKSNGDIVHRIHIRNGYETVATLERYEYAQPESDALPTDFASYYHRDMLGSGLLITGSKAEEIKRKGYTPYGEALPDYMMVPYSGNAMMVSSVPVPDGVTKGRVATYLMMSNGQSAGNFKQLVEKAEQDAGVELSEGEITLLSRALTVNSVTDGLRGFTGHEMLDDSQLVHMNARLYDPAMGRFMTPDSIIPEPGKPQAYNRYSYVYNNPASYTDPSGHNPFVIAAIVYFVTAHAYSDSQFHHTLSSVLLAAATWGAVGPASVAEAAATAGATTLVTSAALSGRISGTELRAAAFSAVAAGTAYSIGSVNVSDSDWAYKVMYHGASQGAIGWVRNKDFWGSALAGAAGHAAGAAMQGAGFNGTDWSDIAARTAVAATFGGLAAKATGGDFAQGAMVAAIVYLYNTQSHSTKKSGQMGRNNKSPYFRGKTEQEILDYMQSEGLWNGKDDITFFGERPLGGPNGIFVRLGENLNINLLHEHAFGIESGRLVNIGYTGEKLGVAADPVLSQGDYSSYVFNKTVYQGNMNSAASSILQSGVWDGGNYGLIMHNCQDFADAMRGAFIP